MRWFLPYGHFGPRLASAVEPIFKMSSIRIAYGWCAFVFEANYPGCEELPRACIAPRKDVEQSETAVSVKKRFHATMVGSRDAAPQGSKVVLEV